MGGPLSGLVSNTLLDAFGWIGVFWSMAAFSAAGKALFFIRIAHVNKFR